MITLGSPCLAGDTHATHAAANGLADRAGWDRNPVRRVSPPLVLSSCWYALPSGQREVVCYGALSAHHESVAVSSLGERGLI